MSDVLNKYPVVKVPIDFISNRYAHTSISLPDEVDYPSKTFDNDLFDKYQSIIGVSAAIGVIGLVYSFISVYSNETYEHLIIWSIYSVAWILIIVQVSNTNYFNKRNFESEQKKLMDSYLKNKDIRSNVEHLNFKIKKIQSSKLSNDKKRLKILRLKEQYYNVEKTVSTFNRKGFLEDFFLGCLKSNFSEVNIETDVEILGYTPDYILSIPDLAITLIVEIDEPYSFYDLEPIHLDDSFRDAEFISNNIGVVRFTEKQVHNKSSKCILCIESVIEIMKGKSTVYYNTDLKENGWTKSQSLRWIEEGYREAYLGIKKREKHADSDNYLYDELGI